VGRPTRVKVCGITRVEDALLAAELRAFAVGFIFWPASPRFIDPYRARAIAAALPPDVATVGVFVDQPADYVKSVAGLVPLGVVQLHGAESIDDFAQVRCRLIRAIGLADDIDQSSIDRVPSRVTVLLDAHDPIRRGGTGRTVDWSVAAGIAKRRPTILSGGLTPDNVRAAIDVVQPYAIDVSSGVESAPGVKDAAKLRALFSAIGET
jgi:phosphoribosylanthranilate isomerase